MAQKLYLVRGHEVDGENQDLFIVAENPQSAIHLWNEWCLENGLPRVDGDDENKAKIHDPENVRVIVEDVSMTEYASKEDRWIEWEDLKTVA